MPRTERDKARTPARKARATKDSNPYTPPQDNPAGEASSTLAVPKPSKGRRRSKRLAAGAAPDAAAPSSPPPPTNPPNDPPSLQNTEKVIEAQPPPRLPAFPVYQFKSFGDNVLLIIPTNNKHKKRLLRKYIASRSPRGVKVHVKILKKVESGVGEQPYNRAGVEGACGRIRNALLQIQTPEFARMLESKKIGTVMVGAIENFIQVKRIDRPADFGIIVVHNATKNVTKGICSRGVTIDMEFVKKAQSHGCCNGNPDHGNKTVGEVLHELDPRIDSANWHEWVAGVSRYVLLEEALAQLAIPW